MTDQLTLFGLPETLSPKEAWKREHNILTLPPGQEPGETGDEPTEDLGFPKDKWVAWQANGSDGPPTGEPTAFGTTEELALFYLAGKLSIAFYQ